MPLRYQSFSNYADAAEHLGTREQRTLRGVATYLHRVDAATVAVRYHATDVVTYHADGSITLRSGGWNTATTKARLDEYSRFSVGSVDGTWYVSARRATGETEPVSWSDDRYPVYEWTSAVFADGMTLADADDPFGSVVAFAASDAASIAHAAAERDRVIRREVNAYVRTAFSDTAFAAMVERARTDGTGGDCWLCSMFDDDTADHLREHVAEGYGFVTLAVRAGKERGRRMLCGADTTRRDVRAYLLSRLLEGPAAGRRQSSAFAPANAGIAHGSTAGRL